MQTWQSAVLLTGAFVLLTSCATAPKREIVPIRGQTVEQQDRDRWECGVWAQQQTAYDPGASRRNGAILALLAGGAFGSALGAAVGAVQEAAGFGAAVGALTGGLLAAPVGGYVQERRDRDAVTRAFHACLEGRGYAAEPPAGSE